MPSQVLFLIDLDLTLPLTKSLESDLANFQSVLLNILASHCDVRGIKVSFRQFNLNVFCYIIKLVGIAEEDC